MLYIFYFLYVLPTGVIINIIYIFVCPLAYLKNHHPIFTNFLYMLPVAVTRSISDGIAICYVLPVLWIASCYHIMERMGQNQRRRVRFVQFARRRLYLVLTAIVSMYNLKARTAIIRTAVLSSAIVLLLNVPACPVLPPQQRHMRPQSLQIADS